MRISVLAINFYPELIGIGGYTTEMCEYLKNTGHKVTVFTGFPYYPHWRIPKEYKGKLFVTEEYNGIIVKRSYLYVPSKVTTKSRILHEISFIISSCFNILLSEKADLIITVSPPLGLGLVSYIVSRLKGVPFVFHIQDLQPDAAVELGMLKNKRILKLLYKTEKLIYKKATKVFVISRKMKEKIVSKGIKREKIIFFPNWVDTEYIKPLSRNNNRFRQEYNLGDRFVILYSGNIGIKQGLDVILDVADKTRDNKNIIYVIVGNGAYRRKLVEKCERLSLNNLLFLPVQSKEMLPYMLSAADVCLIPQQKTITDIVMPSKLLGIMASGKPVIAGANKDSELYNVIKDAACGIIVEPENPDQIMSAIEEICNDPQKAEEYGKNGRENAVKYFSKEQILKFFEEEIKGIIS